MAIGTVKFFNTAKRFGFITPEDGGKDIFVHKKAVELAGITNLSQGQRLSFETVRDAKGAVLASDLKPYQEERVPTAATNGRLGPTGRGSSLTIHRAEFVISETRQLRRRGSGHARLQWRQQPSTGLAFHPP